MRLETEITLIYKKYSKEIREAHSKVLSLEKTYRNRTNKDKEIIKQRIIKIVGDTCNDNK